jgi:hypothetical protein
MAARQFARAALEQQGVWGRYAPTLPPWISCSDRHQQGHSRSRRRVFKEDILQCASCGGRRKVTAFIPSGPMAREILERLGVDATGPPVAKARARPHQEHFGLHPEDPGVDSQYPD